MFNSGELYKRSEIHDQYGGNRQTGISNCPSNGLIFIFTKPKKSQDVYIDEWKNDYFYYSGEGRVGDMQMTGGNKAIWEHQANSKEIHLFQKTDKSGYWEYIDQLKLVDLEPYRNIDDNGNERDAFQFVLLSTTKAIQKNAHPRDGEDYDYNIPNKTERKGLVISRVGQGYYRKKLLKRWGFKCAVTNSSIERILIASHILPWSKSNNAQRLDIGNGILLSPNLDALFDKHIISFDASGKILLSAKISNSEYKSLNISEKLGLRHVYPDMLRYLKKHRDEFFEKERI